MQPVFFDQFTCKNHSSLGKLVNCIFDYVDSILIIRIDLGYKKEFSDQITLSVIQEHRARMLDNRRQNELFAHLLGYSWHIDNGEFANDVGAHGLHHQFLFIFNGINSHSEALIGGQIAAYFETVITHGWGYGCYSSGLATGEKIGFLGSQLIHRTDIELHNHLLEHVAGHLTHPSAPLADLRAELNVASRFRTFSRSRVWKPLPINHTVLKPS
ncbi:MAG: hypothetical protein ACOYL3_28885 [Desulfuromonadaceae bacterium]